MTPVKTAWSRVLASFGTPARPRRHGDERLWLGPSDRQHVTLSVPGKPSFLVICAKSAPLVWRMADGSMPQDVGAVVAPFPADERAVALFRPLCLQAPASVFLGDLDPFSIVQYVELRRLLLEQTGRPLLYGGVDDAWLASSDRSLKRGLAVERICIALSRSEQSLLKRIERAIDIEQLVGRRSCSLLRSGYKLELEGASNPVAYRKDHGRWVFRRLRALVRRSGGAAHA
jgi:hypothetical protein